MLTIFKLAKNTLTECLREPIFFLMLLSSMVLIGLFPTAALFVFREQLKFVIDSAMAATLVFSLFAGVLCAAHTISREMRNGTVLLLLSKPVTRGAFVAAKILGILAAVTIFVFLCNAATVISVLVAKDQFRFEHVTLLFYFATLAGCCAWGGLMNYFKQKNFMGSATAALLAAVPVLAAILYIIRISSFHSHAEIDPEEFIEISYLIGALLLLFPSAWAMSSIAAALATRIELVSNLTLCSVIFLVGLVSRYLMTQWFGEGLGSSFLRTLLPNWQYFWMADAVASRTPVPLSYLAWSLVYVAFYIGFWTLWAMAFFSEKEVARDSR